MPKVLVSNNSELLRHLTTPPFRRLELDLHVVSSGDEAVAAFARDQPRLAILDAELAGVSGYDIASKIKEASPSTKATWGSNSAHLSVRYDQRTGWVVVLCAIDNLVKGASGQAIQCANLALGLEETAGLSTVGIYP